jgi:LysM repeat protein
MSGNPPVRARLLLFLTLVTPAIAAGAAVQAPLLQPTPFATPTPNSEGAILYTVRDGDSLWRIAAIAEISVQELMALNGIQSGDFISPGMELVLGSVAPTRTPVITATPPVQASPVIGAGEICVMLFLDANGNARLDEDELPLPDGQVSVADRQGRVAGEHTTDENPEGHCFADLSDGDYNVSAAVPPNHNPTTSMNVPVALRPGDIKFVQFGGQPSGAIVPQGGLVGGSSSLLGAVGVVMLGAAGLLGYFAVRSGRRR